MNATEAAKNQSFFREANERMRGLNESLEQGVGGADFLCGVCREGLHAPLAPSEGAAQSDDRAAPVV